MLAMSGVTVLAGSAAVAVAAVLLTPVSGTCAPGGTVGVCTTVGKIPSLYWDAQQASCIDGPNALCRCRGDGGGTREGGDSALLLRVLCRTRWFS